MPDESCRSCGGELAKYLLCAQCKKTIQWICKMCSKETAAQRHILCLPLVLKTNLTQVSVTG